MGAYDDEQFGWLSQTKALLSLAVRRSVPTLAICLGHQLLAVAEGGVVERGATGQQVGLPRAAEPRRRPQRTRCSAGWR